MTNPIIKQTAPHTQYPTLDILRFLACLLVVLNHLRGNQFLPFWQVQCDSTLAKQVFFVLTRLGSEAVVVFFVISGFLVGGTTVERFLNGDFAPWKYFIDRLARIYTPLIPNVFLCAAVAASIGIPTSWAEVASTLASLQMSFGGMIPLNLSLWSLAYEVWLYMICGGLLMLLQQRGTTRTLVAFIIVAASAVVLARLNTSYLLAWILGMCAYFLRGRMEMRHLIVALPMVLAGGVGMQLTSISVQIDLAKFAWIDRRLAVLCLATGSAIAISVIAPLKATTPIGRRISVLFHWLASFSYTFYLIHTPLIITLFRLEILRPCDTLTLSSLIVFIMTNFIIGFAAWVMALPFEFQTDTVRKWLYARVPLTYIR